MHMMIELLTVCTKTRIPVKLLSCMIHAVVKLVFYFFVLLYLFDSLDVSKILLLFGYKHNTLHLQSIQLKYKKTCICVNQFNVF